MEKEWKGWYKERRKDKRKEKTKKEKMREEKRREKILWVSIRRCHYQYFINFKSFFINSY